MSSLPLTTKGRQGISTSLMVALLLLASMLSLMTALVTVMGNVLFLMLLLIIIVGGSLILKPRYAVWVVIIGGTIVSGLTELYLPSFQQIRWAVALLSMTLILLAAGTWMFYDKEQSKKKLSSDAKVVVGLVIIFIASVILTLISNSLSLQNSIVGLKNYFQMFGLFAALMVFQYTPKEATRFMKYIVILGLLQLPFALHQFIHFVPLRSTLEAAQLEVVAVDVVSGTFGGSAMGGGRSSTLAILAAIAILIVLGEASIKTKSILKAALYIIVFTMPLLLNEAKLFLLLLPIGLLILFRDYVVKNLIKAIALGIVVIGFLISIFAVYSILPGANSQTAISFEKYLEQNISYNFGERGYGSSLLNRTTVYPFWWHQNVEQGKLINVVFGHGPGSTNASSVVATKTLANTRYRGYGIGLTGVSALLWEVGVLGTLAVFFLLLRAYVLGGNLEKKWRGTEHWPYIKSAQAAVAFFAISMLHNNYFVSDISFQALLVLFIGYLIAMSRCARVD